MSEHQTNFCKGKIQPNGHCDTCFQTAQTSSIDCGRIITTPMSAPTKSVETKRKFLIVAEMRDIEQQYAREEISYSRMVEIINEKAEIYANSRAVEALKEAAEVARLEMKVFPIELGGGTGYQVDKQSILTLIDKYK